MGGAHLREWEGQGGTTMGKWRDLKEDIKAVYRHANRIKRYIACEAFGRRKLDGENINLEVLKNEVFSQ